MKTLHKALATVLVRHRIAAKLSQEELADRASIHRTYVSQIERGLKSPTLSVFFEISRALNVVPSQLIAEVEKEIND